MAKGKNAFLSPDTRVRKEVIESGGKVDAMGLWRVVDEDGCDAS